MATLTVLRRALGEGLKGIPGLVVSPRLAEIQTLGDGGGCVVGGPTTDYVGAMARGNVTWEIPIHLLVPTSNYDRATELLDELVNPYGDRSVHQRVWDLGRAVGGGFGVVDSQGAVDADYHIDALVAYGVEFANAGVPHLGAVLNCVVHSPGYPT
jgi:hypothetical protein